MRHGLLLLTLLICLPAKAQRIVALSPHLVENLYAIGAGEQVVGTLEHADYPQQAKRIPRIGGYYGVQMEKLLALKPDIVLAWQGGNKAQDIAAMRKLGLNVVLSNTTRIEELADELRLLGRLTGREARSEQLALRIEKRLAHIRKRYQGGAHIRVFYQLWPEPMMTVGEGTLINQLIDLCGGDNVFADASTSYPQISLENVLASRPEVIILPEDKGTQDTKAVQWENWPDIPAVQHRSFIRVDADVLHRFTPRLLDGLEDMCQKIKELQQTQEKSAAGQTANLL